MRRSRFKAEMQGQLPQLRQSEQEGRGKGHTCFHGPS